MGSPNPIWIGDFNFPMINFRENICNDRDYDEVFEAVTGHGLDQLIEESTHDGGNQLDLMFAGPESKLASFKVEPQLDDFDHRLQTWAGYLTVKTFEISRFCPLLETFLEKLLEIHLKPKPN